MYLKVGAVVSEDQKCSNIGISLIEEGGSAADAIIGFVKFFRIFSNFYQTIHSI